MVRDSTFSLSCTLSTLSTCSYLVIIIAVISMYNTVNRRSMLQQLIRIHWSSTLTMCRYISITNVHIMCLCIGKTRSRLAWHAWISFEFHKTSCHPKPPLHSSRVIDQLLPAQSAERNFLNVDVIVDMANYYSWTFNSFQLWYCLVGWPPTYVRKLSYCEIIKTTYIEADGWSWHVG